MAFRRPMLRRAIYRAPIKQVVPTETVKKEELVFPMDCSKGCVYSEEHITPTYHKLTCMRCGKIEKVDSSG